MSVFRGDKKCRKRVLVLSALFQIVGTQSLEATVEKKKRYFHTQGSSL